MKIEHNSDVEKITKTIPKPWILVKLSCFEHFRPPNLEATPKCRSIDFREKKVKNIFDQKS